MTKAKKTEKKEAPKKREEEAIKGTGSESADTNKPEEQVAPKDNADIERAKADAKEQGRQEALKEIEDEKKTDMAELNDKIRELQSKKSKDPDEKARLTELMQERAKYNATLPRNLDKLTPSQMTVIEYHQYCDKKIEQMEKDVEAGTLTQTEADRKTQILSYEEGEPNKKTRLRIAAFRNPAKEKDLATFDVQKVSLTPLSNR